MALCRSTSLAEDPLMTEHIPTRNSAEVRFACPNCGISLQASAARPGTRFSCPKCGAAGIVPNPGDRDISDGYDLGSVPERPRLAVFNPPPPPREEDERPESAKTAGAPKTASERAAYSDYHRPALPIHPMVDGIFDFFGSRRVVAAWAGLSLGLAFVLACFSAALFTGRLGQIGMSGGPVENIAAMVLLGVTFLSGLLWAVPMFVHCLNITQETAAGNRMLASLPDVVWIDWVQESLFVVLPMLAAGVGASVVGGYLPVAREFVVATVFLVLFPVFVLSALEEQACYAVLSLRVARSLGFAGTTWLIFLAESAALVLALGIVDLLARSVLSAVGTVLPTPAMGARIVFLAVEVVTAMMVYFRLLGRVAWVIESKEREVEEADEEE